MASQLIQSDEFYALCDRVEAVLEAEGKISCDGLTPSAAARKAHITTADTRRVLTYLVANEYVWTSGNGAWTRYHAGRGGY